MSLARVASANARSLQDYAGARVATDYGDVEAEWRALDSGTALVDASQRRTIVATGEERIEFLQGQLSHDLSSLGADGGVPALLLTAQGRVVSMLAVHHVGDAFHLVTDAAGLARTRARLEEFLVADDVEFDDAPPVDRFAVAGPGAPGALAAAGIETPADRPWFSARTNVEGCAVTLYGRGDLRVPFVELAVEGDGASLWERLAAGGARAAGAAALEIVRVESGTARMGVDVDEERLALEARLEWAIHFRKGCYVGQEIIERAVSRGRVNRRLCLLATERLAVAGTRIDGGADKEVVTSAVVSPRLGPVCLAYVARESSETGSRLALAGDGGAIDARVLVWPRPETLAGRQERTA